MKEEGGEVSHLGVYHRGTCLCLVHVSKANLRAFCLSFFQFIKQIPLLFVTANMVLVKDGSRSARPSLQQLGWECAAVRDQHREPLASFMQVEDRPELQGWSSSISCAEEGMSLLFLHPVHYCSAVGTAGTSKWYRS